MFLGKIAEMMLANILWLPLFSQSFHSSE